MPEPRGMLGHFRLLSHAIIGSGGRPRLLAMDPPCAFCRGSFRQAKAVSGACPFPLVFQSLWRWITPFAQHYHIP